MIERGVILTDNNHTIDLDAFFPSLSEPTHPLNSIKRNGTLGAERLPLDRQPLQSDSGMLPQDLLCDQLLSEEFSLEAMEEQLIRTAMDRVEGNVSKAARLLGMTRPQLAYRLKKLDSD
jgi:DNA-binding NtrC family response regulator